MSTSELSPHSETLRSRLHGFFYAQEAPYGMAAVRIGITFTTLCAMAPRWIYTREIFSTDGAATPLWFGYGTAPLYPEPSAALAVALHSLLLLTLLTGMLGWCTRTSLAIAAPIYLYLGYLDTISTLTKYSVVTIHLLFLVALSQSGAVWSIDSWLRRARLRRAGQPPETADAPPLSSAWPRRLAQFMMCTVYFGAAATKFHTPAFFSGEQMQTWMLTDYNLPNLLGSRFAMHPALLVVFAYISVIWEITFLFLVWRKSVRWIVLVMGTIFHVMTLLTLGLFIFPMVCISGYLAFLDQEDVAAIRRRLLRWRTEGGRLKAAAAKILTMGPSVAPPPIAARTTLALFGIAAVIFAGGGVWVEQRLDLYGMNRPEGPHTLKEIPLERIAQVIAPSKRIRHEDMLMNFDLGTIIVGGALLNSRSQFYHGDTLRAQGSLLPPHEDLFVECSLHDWDNHIIETVPLCIATDVMRVNFHFTIGEALTPGDYSIVFKVAGDELIRRPISILPRTKSASAN